MASFLSDVSYGDIPSTNADYIASGTLIPLLKGNLEDIHQLRDLLGDDLARPLAISCFLVKLACNCSLTNVKGVIKDVTGAVQFAIGCKGGGASPFNGRCKSLLGRQTRNLPMLV